MSVRRGPLLAVAFTAALLGQTAAFAGALPRLPTPARHPGASQKVKCMKRLMWANRKIFYVDASRMCDSAPPARRSHLPAPPLVATMAAPSAQP